MICTQSLVQTKMPNQVAVWALLIDKGYACRGTQEYVGVPSGSCVAWSKSLSSSPRVLWEFSLWAMLDSVHTCSSGLDVLHPITVNCYTCTLSWFFQLWVAEGAGHQQYLLLHCLVLSSVRTLFHDSTHGWRIRFTGITHQEPSYLCQHITKYFFWSLTFTYESIQMFAKME